jgi:hypothetical protein
MLEQFRQVELRHVMLGAVLCVVLPAASWIDGSGWLAWTMFSRSEMYRLRLDVTDRAGNHRIVNPTELARVSSVDLATFLSGSESWRHGPVGRTFARSLGGLAERACRLPGDLTSVRLRLETRRNLDAPIEVFQDARACQ